MHGWHCYIFKTYPSDKLSKLRTTGPWGIDNPQVSTGLFHSVKLNGLHVIGGNLKKPEVNKCSVAVPVFEMF